MKRSPPAAALSSSCSSSSSVGFESPKRRRKRPTRTLKPRQSNTNQNQTINGCRRSSIYRGVTRHRLTGRFEAHLWDKSSWNSVQTKKGRQVYLGAYDIEETAARTYDLAALKYWGKDAILNFLIETYTKELEEMDKFTREEYLASLRRHSNGFSRGVSKYRGVARHHHNGRWEARIGRVNGSKYIYLGTFETQEEAAEAYDKAALEYRGVNAVTNFDKRKYKDQIAERKSEQSQETGTVQKRKKKSEQSQTTGTVPNFSESEVAEVLRTTKQPPPENPVTQQQQQQQHQSVQCSDVPQTMESPPVTTSSVVDNNVPDQDLPWSFMDSGLPDMTLSNADDFLSMFDGVDLDADIHFLFGSEPTESDFSLSAVLGSIGSEDVLCGAAGNKNKVDDIKQNKQSSSSSPASSSSSFSSSQSSPKDTSPSPKSP